MPRNSFLFLLLIFCSFTTVGQKFNLGKVTKPELMEMRHATDTSAPAAIIFKKAKTEFKYTEENGFSLETVFQVKLKVYKEEGLKWANFKIPYYIGYKTLEDEIVNIESAYTYNLEDGKIVKSKVTSESKFKQQINENWGAKSLTFPNVKKGSIIELEYTLKSQNLSILPDFQYQYNIPVNYAEFKTNIPAFYTYSGVRKGYVEVKIDQKIEPASQSYVEKVGLAASADRHLEYNQIATIYSVFNVPALQEEDYVDNIDNYYGQLTHELQTIHYPNQPAKQIATDWESVAKSIYEDKDFKTAINQFDYFSSDVKSLIEGVTSPQEKVKKIFNFVKNRMNWNEKYGYYPQNKMDQVYFNKIGNVAEINLMLVSMLKMAGIDSSPVLISTRENGLVLFPNRTLFNYIIAAALIDNKTILLDATDKNANLNVLPIRDLNSTGRLIKNDGNTTEVDLMPKSNSKESVNIIAAINKNGEVSGKISDRYFDYEAFVFRDKYNGLAKEAYIEKLERKQQGLEIKEYAVQNSLDLELPVIETYDFTATGSTEIIGDKIYFSPLLHFSITENPFKQDYREYPIDFKFPRQDKFSITITIPEGYVVETLPQGKEVNLTQNLGSFSYLISETGNQIQLSSTININKASYDSGYYPALKEFFKQIIEKQTEKIVLKKV